MTIVNLLLCVLWLFIIPIVLGYGIILLSKYNKNMGISFALVIGMVVEFAIYQLYSIPFTIYSKTFEELLQYWKITVLVLFALSLIHCIFKIKDIFSFVKIEVRMLPKILTLILLMITILQCVYECKTVTYNYDDYNMLAIGNISRQTNTLFKYDFNGYPLDMYNSGIGRYAFSQFPNFTASIAECCNMHTLVMAHSVLPVFVIILAYNVYYLLGKSLFNKNLKSALYFVFAMMLVYLFSGFSDKFYTIRLLNKAWQGKGICANIIFPFTLYIFIEYIDKEKDFFYWFIMQIVFLGSVLLSNVGMLVLPIFVALLTIIFFIKDRRFLIFPKAVFAVLPTLFYVVWYIKLFGV